LAQSPEHQLRAEMYPDPEADPSDAHHSSSTGRQLPCDGGSRVAGGAPRGGGALSVRALQCICRTRRRYGTRPAIA